MKRILVLTNLLFIITFYVNSQDGCKSRKPAKLEKYPFNINNRLTSDRFYHTINSDITKQKHFQIESALFLRDEYYEIDGSNKNKQSSTFNIYSSYKIKYAILNNVEIQCNLTDIIFLSGAEIKEFGGDNPYSRTSLGVKYKIFNSQNEKNILGLFSQIGLLKLQKSFSFLPEVRIMYSNKLTNYLFLTCNIGDVFINMGKNTLIYGIEMKLLISRRIELFAEYFKNYTNMGYIINPNKRLLSGIGVFSHENTYFYCSYENGFDKSDLLKLGKIDIGLTHRF
jgi:hypothetical protein